MKGRHPEGAAKRPSKDAAPKISGRRPWRLAELVIWPATSGRTHWLAPQGDGRKRSNPPLNPANYGRSGRQGNAPGTRHGLARGTKAQR